MNTTRNIFSSLILLAFIISCKLSNTTHTDQESARFSVFLNNYYEERLKYYPLEATNIGDSRYNDLLPNNITVSFKNQLSEFYQRNMDSLNKFNRVKLPYNDQISYDVLQWELQINLDGLKFQDELMPINQFWSLTLTMGQLASGSGVQPFKTARDYDNFLSRINGFVPWCDTAIANMRRGIKQGYVLPKILVERIIPQVEDMITEDISQHIFYSTINNFPPEFSQEEKDRLKAAYTNAIRNQVIPSYEKLYRFFREEYLPAARTTSGISTVRLGTEYYNFLARQWTTTNLTPDQIFKLGESEVARIRSEMEKIKDLVAYKGDLKSFFEFARTDKQFYPFKTDSEVIGYYKNIYAKSKIYVDQIFSKQPVTNFEIRQTEKFREASASAEYQQASADGTRPGVFYIPIIDATKFNYVGSESLFLHEAIPGHHFQISLQQENNLLPQFRKFIWYGAYGEGWALYTESLGEQLGLYSNPYEKLGNLSAEMHRAIRLVVDVGIHLKGWTREQAIAYSLENETDPVESITAEIERYMAIPGQALSYKIGQLKIIELRNRAQQVLGDRFNYGEFHEEILKNGCLPLAVLEKDFEKWLKEKSAG